jgi:hypothetical protein
MSLRRAWLTYTLGRLGLFVLVALLAWGAAGLLGHPLDGMPLLLVALIGSALLSMVLLRAQRDRFGQALAEGRAAKAAEQAARRARLDDAPEA